MLIIPLKLINLSIVNILVRVEGLEPPCLAAPDPKSGMSTNFTTPAFSNPRLQISLTNVQSGI